MTMRHNHEPTATSQLNLQRLNCLFHNFTVFRSLLAVVEAKGRQLLSVKNLYKKPLGTN